MEIVDNSNCRQLGTHRVIGKWSTDTYIPM